MRSHHPRRPAAFTTKSSHRTARLRFPALFVTLASFAATARAQTTPYHYFHTDQTFTNSGQPGDKGSAIVGFDSQDPNTLAFLNPSDPSLTFSTNSIYQNDMWVYNNSVVSFNGGTTNPTSQPGGAIGTYLNSFDTSTIHVDDRGSVPTLTTYNNSQLFMSGGSIGKNTGQVNNTGLYAHDSSTLHISGGTVNQLFLADSSTLILSGGTVATACWAQGAGSSITVTSGFASDLSVSQGAALVILGGSFNDVSVGADSSANIDNATIANLLNVGNGSATFHSGSAAAMTVNSAAGVANLTGATVTGDVRAANAGTANLDSGSVGGNLIAASAGVINLNGIAVAGNATLADGTLNLNSGSIAGNLIITGGGTLNWSNNTSVPGALIVQSGPFFTFNHDVGSLQATGTGTTQMTGGAIPGAVQISNSASLLMAAGSIGPASSSNFAQITLSGGQTQSLDSYDSSDLYVHATAQITGNLTTHDSSSATIDGGTIAGNLVAQNQSTINFTGGSVSGNLQALSNTVTLAGGQIAAGLDAGAFSYVYLQSGSVAGPVNVHDYATLSWTGGSLSPGPSGAYIRDHASLQIQGFNLQTSLLDPNSGGGAFSEYQLSGYAGDGTPIPNGFDIFVQNNSTASLQLQPGSQQWKPDTSGSWADRLKWLPNLVPNAPGATVSFGSPDYTSSAPVTISFDGNHTVGNLTFGASGPGVNFTISAGAGGVLTLDNQGNAVSLNVLNANHQITPPVVANDDVTAFFQDYYSFDKSDVSLTLLNGISFALGKTLTVIGPGSLNTAGIRNGSLNVINAPVHILPSFTHIVISRLQGLTLSPTATLDLDTTLLILEYSTTSPADTLRSYIHSAYNNGSWTGPGLTSSFVQNTPNHSLAYADASDTNLANFLAISITSPSFLITYALTGDANLDGKVNADDYTLLDRSYAQHLSNPHWTDGDFNYDGIIDQQDYLLIDRTYLLQSQAQGFSPGSLLSQRESQFGSTYVTELLTSLPEPSLLAACGLAFPLLTRRKPRPLKSS